MLKMCLMKLQRKSKRSPDKGEITIYLSLVFALILSLLLSVITASRGAALQVAFECGVESSLLSTFGEYNRELFDKYDVFFVDMSYMSNSPDSLNLEDKMERYLSDNLHPENDEKLFFVSDFLDVDEVHVSLTEYELASDSFGKPFADQAVNYMKNLIGVPRIEEISSFISLTDTYNIKSEVFEEKKEDLLTQINDKDTNNWCRTILKDDSFDLLSPDIAVTNLIGLGGFDISSESIPLTDTLLVRAKQKGNLDDHSFEFDPTSSILFSEYALLKLGNFTDVRDESKLKYEIEYVIAGLGSDEADFYFVVGTVYVMRVLEDLASICMDSSVMEAIRGLGEGLEALIYVPEPVFTAAVVLIWACAEAFTDVKDLLNGEKVDFLKDTAEFNIGLNGLCNVAIEDKSDSSISFDGSISVKLGYEDYLRIMLYSIPSVIKTYRVMDMIEADLRNSGEGNEYFRFDACTDKIKAVFSIESGFDFRFITEKEYSYFG